MVKNDIKIKKLLIQIGDTYKEIGIYLKENKWFILFILMLIIEITVFYVINAQADDHYLDYVNETESKYPGLFSFIFIENLKVFTQVFFCGIIPVFLGSLYCTMASVGGLVISFKYIIGLAPLETILICTVPHGIVEIPCLLACIVIGALISKEITLTILRFIRKKDLVFLDKTRTTIGLKKTMWLAMKCWLLIIFPMTLTAALLETYITPIIMGFFGLPV